MKVLLMTLCVTLIGCGDGDRTRLVNGVDGKSCYTKEVELGVNIICGEDITLIPNPKEVLFVEVCPDIDGEFKESLIYNDGMYLAFLSSADYKLQRLTILNENTLYMTTDDRGTMFEIINGEIICQ